MRVGDFGYKPDGSLATTATAANGGAIGPWAPSGRHPEKPDVEQRIDLGSSTSSCCATTRGRRRVALNNNAGVAFGQHRLDGGALRQRPPRSPMRLAKAGFQHFPEVVLRPSSRLRRRTDHRLRRRPRRQAVLKAAPGLRRRRRLPHQLRRVPNLNQIIGPSPRDGYVVAQELPPEGRPRATMRLFVMNGRPSVDREVCRVPADSRARKDVRSNMSVGGRTKAKVTDEHAPHG